MSRKLAMSLAAALILSNAIGSITANADELEYHGGPKSAGTVSVGGGQFGSITEDAGVQYHGGPKSHTAS
jgi:hypothetical protein